MPFQITLCFQIAIWSKTLTFKLYSALFIPSTQSIPATSISTSTLSPSNAHHSPTIRHYCSPYDRFTYIIILSLCLTCPLTKCNTQPTYIQGCNFSIQHAYNLTSPLLALFNYAILNLHLIATHLTDLQSLLCSKNSIHKLITHPFLKMGVFTSLSSGNFIKQWH